MGWIADRESVAGGIVGFCGQPLADRGRCWACSRSSRAAASGRAPMLAADDRQHRAAVAIANAKAFEGIAALKRRLEEEMRVLAAGGAGGQRLRRARRPRPGPGGPPAADRAGRPHGRNGADPGRNGHRQGAGRAGDPRRSAAPTRPLIEVNCAAIPRELFESEFFGHVKGAFTGAMRDRAGRFELADGGTLFLDEIGEIPLELQAQAPPRAAGERVGARGRRADAAASMCGSSPRPTGTSREAEAGRFRRGPLLPPHVFPPRRRPCASGPRTSRRRSISCGRRPCVRGAGARSWRTCGSCWGTTGRETSASCST